MNIPFLQAHETNFYAGRWASIEYIVIHYVGALGGAEDNARYYANHADLHASAHYFVGFDGEVWQGVKDTDTAKHCGGGLQGNDGHTYYGKCKNANSIGIEMCVRKRSTRTLLASDKDWYFEAATVRAAQELTRELMDKHNIPSERVIRHYDVTGKICPNPYVLHPEQWDDFKAGLTAESEDDMAVRFKTIDDVPAALRAETQQLIDAGALKGKGGELGLDVTEDMLRCMIICKRYADGRTE